jgi:hypothetical protein
MYPEGKDAYRITGRMVKAHLPEYSIDDMKLSSIEMVEHYIRNRFRWRKRRSPGPEVIRQACRMSRSQPVFLEHRDGHWITRPE